jgi:cytochrome b6-f complex iron-sulfur subunit
MATDRETKLTRRSFCNTALLVSAGLVLMPDEVKGQKPTEEQALLAYPPMKIEGAERLMPGSSLYFTYPKASDPAVLLRTMDGQFLAFSRKCAHLGCSIDFDKAQRCLVCPCHRGVYDSRTGYVVYGPPPRPLDQVILQVRAGGELWAVGKSLGGNQNASAGVPTNLGGSN